MKYLLIATHLAVALISAWFVSNSNQSEISRLQGKITTLQVDHREALVQRDIDQAEEEAAIAKALSGKLIAEYQRGNGLADQLAQAESTIAKKSKELNREIARHTTGSQCLNSGTVRLLNDAAHDAGVPGSASQPATEDGAIATDTDIAWWITTAREQYDLCRARLGALIDFETGKNHAGQ